MGCMSACFEWADSYDSKDWNRLSKCIAPTLRVSPFIPLLSFILTTYRSTTAPS
ncbi:hypothetical protein N431DRAFT_433665 [Stipitochalara longipes BDJ]|nr:hypothetical protein N431DRAFT_433665 [Stipitochalara longipes BDJ]